MKSRFLPISLVVVFGISWSGLAQQPARQDGTQWNAVTASLRLGYVIGFVDAALWAHTNSDAEVKLLKSPSESDRKSLRDQAAVWDYSNITYGQLVDGIDTFYKDYRNQSITWDRAISYVRDEIHGASPDSLEREIEFERKLAAAK